MLLFLLGVVVGGVLTVALLVYIVRDPSLRVEPSHRPRVVDAISARDAMRAADRITARRAQALTMSDPVGNVWQ